MRTIGALLKCRADGSRVSSVVNLFSHIFGPYQFSYVCFIIFFIFIQHRLAVLDGILFRALRQYLNVS